MCGVKKEFRNKGLAKELIIIAINELIKYPIENKGFMYLTETFTILKKKNFKISEQATVFINRKKGSSSLRFSEILRSLVGIIKLKLKKL